MGFGSETGVGDIALLVEAGLRLSGALSQAESGLAELTAIRVSRCHAVNNREPRTSEDHSNQLGPMQG